jgi:serine/threonine protein kinase
MTDTLTSLTVALAGRYRLERELGQGGMPTVFLARDTKHDRPVALKVLKPELGAVLGVERFLSEIRVTGGGLAIVGRTTLFEGDYQSNPLSPTYTSYDVARDDRHFVMLRRAGNARPDIVIWMNWLDELRARTRQR